MAKESSVHEDVAKKIVFAVDETLDHFKINAAREEAAENLVRALVTRDENWDKSDSEVAALIEMLEYFDGVSGQLM